MAAGRAHDNRNDASRRRLAALIAPLTDADLRLRTHDRWTIQADLAHLAYWDRATLLRWQRHRAGIQLVYTPDALTDVLNEAALDFWTALDPRWVADEVIAAADALDREIVSLPDALLEGAAREFPTLLNRGHHREEHIAEIERVLSARR